MSFNHLGLSPELLARGRPRGLHRADPGPDPGHPLRPRWPGPARGRPDRHRQDRRIRPADDPAAPRSRPSGPRVIRALILTPTRELALQVEESVRTYGAQQPIRSTTIYGGVGFDPQVRALRAGPEIVVATPGRLLDHIGQRTIDLSRVEILVLDEADRMLDMGFIRDIRKILAILPPARQNLLFSATFSDEIRRLADGLLHDPAFVQVTPRNTATELVTQVVHPVDRERKRELLSHLIKTGRIDQALVFTRTKHGANRLALQLEKDGIAATAIHGNKSQPQRVRALADFKAGRFTVLVATEVAARGLDIEALPHVVNFELPMVPEDYVHRIGRTGRAGVDGDAVSLVCVDEAKLLRDIEVGAAPPDPGRGHRGLRARPAHPPRADPSRWSRQRSARTARGSAAVDIAPPPTPVSVGRTTRAARSTAGRVRLRAVPARGAMEPRSTSSKPPRPSARPVRRAADTPVRDDRARASATAGLPAPARASATVHDPDLASSESRGGDDRRPSYGDGRSQQRPNQASQGHPDSRADRGRRPRTAAVGPGTGGGERRPDRPAMDGQPRSNGSSANRQRASGNGMVMPGERLARNGAGVDR